jgi:hypothetical protein
VPFPRQLCNHTVTLLIKRVDGIPVNVVVVVVVIVVVVVVSVIALKKL